MNVIDIKETGLHYLWSNYLLGDWMQIVRSRRNNEVNCTNPLLLICTANITISLFRFRLFMRMKCAFPTKSTIPKNFLHDFCSLFPLIYEIISLSFVFHFQKSLCSAYLLRNFIFDYQHVRGRLKKTVLNRINPMPCLNPRFLQPFVDIKRYSIGDISHISNQYTLYAVGSIHCVLLNHSFKTKLSKCLSFKSIRTKNVSFSIFYNSIATIF